MFNFINLIYPNVCGMCDKLCENNICKKCELKLNEELEEKINIYSNKYFKKHLYLFKYKGIIREKIIDYKFNDKPYIYKSFTTFILKNKKICDFLESYDIIIPVPIHKKRNRLRGYNQSTLIAKQLTDSIEKLKLESKCMIKCKNNKMQSSLNLFERRKNVIGAYKIKNKEKIENKKVLLFDDIYTTGNTVNECAKVLKEAGAKIIDVFTLAKD